MRNVTVQQSGSILTIAVDLTRTGEVSSSGKSLVIGSTEGNVSIPGHEEIKFGLNVYTKAPVQAIEKTGKKVVRVQFKAPATQPTVTQTVAATELLAVA